MMERKRPLNDLGKWLINELASRDIRRKEFADMIQTTPQNLSDILHGSRFSEKTLQRWKVRFENILACFDKERGIDQAPQTVYQAKCTTVPIEGSNHIVYGIQMLSGRAGHYQIVDEIQDITPHADRILQMVNLFNRERVAAVHFRDMVMDSI